MRERGGEGGGGGERHDPHMRDGEFYDLQPPSVIGGKKYVRVQCEYQVPNHPNEYVVRGIPEGGAVVESFVLRFTDRGVSVTPAAEKELVAPRAATRPAFRVIKGGQLN